MFRSIHSHTFLLRSTAVLFAGLLGLCQALPGAAQTGDDKKPAPKVITLNSLSMEINALHALQQFQFDKEQLEKLQKWAADSPPKEQTRKPAKVSKEYREKMLALRKALQDPKDNDLIQKLSEELDTLHDKEKPTLDDRVESSEAARKRAVEAYQLLKPTQLGFYFGRIAENVVDPLDRLLDAIEDVRELNAEEWKEQRDEIAADVGRLAAGVDGSDHPRVSEATRGTGEGRPHHRRQCQPRDRLAESDRTRPGNAPVEPAFAAGSQSAHQVVQRAEDAAAGQEVNLVLGYDRSSELERQRGAAKLLADARARFICYFFFSAIGVASQMRTAGSAPDEARRWPSGLNATA